MTQIGPAWAILDFQPFVTIHSHFRKCKNEGKTPTWQLIFLDTTLNVSSLSALHTVSHQWKWQLLGQQRITGSFDSLPFSSRQNHSRTGRNQHKYHCSSQRNISNVNGASHSRDAVKILKYVGKGNYFGHQTLKFIMSGGKKAKSIPCVIDPNLRSLGR